MGLKHPDSPRSFHSETPLIWVDRYTPRSIHFSTPLVPQKVDDDDEDDDDDAWDGCLTDEIWEGGPVRLDL